MYSKLRLFEPKNTKFKTKHHFLHRIKKNFYQGLDVRPVLNMKTGFRGLEPERNPEFQIPALIWSKVIASIHEP